MASEFVQVRIPAAQRDRIDAARPATVSREAFVRAAIDRALNGEPESGRPAAMPSRPSVAPRVHLARCACAVCKPEKR